MASGAEDIIATCTHFSRMVSEERDPEELLALLADSAVEHLGVVGAVVYQVTQQGVARVSAARDVPDECCEQVGAELIGQELEERLVETCGGRFQAARTVPLVSGSNLYGALVLLLRSAEELAGLKLRLAQGLADMVAVALDQAFRREALLRSLAEVRASREMLARTERLRAMGELSASIAHDLRNIFNPLLMQVTLLRKRASDPPAVLSAADTLERVVRRGLETVERLRLFGHQSLELRLEELDLNELVDEAVALCRPRLERRAGQVRLRVEHGGRLRVRVRGTELVTALVNLMLNAEEAMPQGGTLSVSTGDTGEHVWLQVSDTGVGMPPEVRERVFEPFFTTKGHQGTGLGLAMVAAFVRHSGGNITVDSTPGQGTTFTLTLPSARREQPGSEAPH